MLNRNMSVKGTETEKPVDKCFDEEPGLTFDFPPRAVPPIQ